MAELNFSAGVRSYTVNGVPDVFSINPTDVNMVERLFNTFNELDEKQKQKDIDIEKVDGAEVFDITRQYDQEMRNAIDGVLGDGVCAKVFPNMNVYALADGLPVWANFMLALIDDCNDTFSKEQKKTNPKIQKYLAKYNKANLKR